MPDKVRAPRKCLESICRKNPLLVLQMPGEAVLQIPGEAAVAFS
jgi:hypothetical protein